MNLCPYFKTSSPQESQYYQKRNQLSTLKQYQLHKHNVRARYKIVESEIAHFKTKL